jgi:hypothetical protein
MHFVEVSGHQIVPTRGGNLESYLAGTDYVVYEGFPRNRDSIYFREAGRQGMWFIGRRTICSRL